MNSFSFLRLSKTDTDPPAAKHSLYSASQEFCNDIIIGKSQITSPLLIRLSMLLIAISKSKIRKSQIMSPLLIRLSMLLIAISKSKISPELQILCCTGKTIQCTWPILASISGTYLSAPPSPVASERWGKSL